MYTQQNDFSVSFTHVVNDKLIYLADVLSNLITNPIDLIINFLLYLIIVNTQQLSYDNLYNKGNEKSFINLIKNTFDYELVVISKAEYEKLVSDNNIIIIKNINQFINIFMNSIRNNKKYSKYQKSYEFLFNNRLDINKLVDFNDSKNLLFLSSHLYFMNDSFMKTINKGNVDIFDVNKETFTLCNIFNYFIKTKEIYNYNNSDFIYEDCINKMYDNIICVFPSDIKNIIHAHCCERIKKLKIRGTKSEPLILQLIMNSLTKDGRAICFVPNHLLYSDSKQHMETRKYLLDNFNVSRIISLDEKNFNKENWSILYFENNGITKEISFEKLVENNMIDKVTSINIKNIKEKDYILYYEKYNNLDCKTDESFISLDEIARILADDTFKNQENNNYLIFPKYFNDNTDIILKDISKLEKDTFTIVTKDQNVCLQEYLNYYLINNLKSDKHLFTSGKLNKIEKDMLLKYKISVPSIKMQKTIISYYELNNQLIQDNNKQIIVYNQMREKLINLIVSNYDTIPLNSICTINLTPSKNTFITINKNSSLAGTVNLYTDNHEKSTNFYYLDIFNDYDKKCLYYLLKNEEKELKKIASLTENISLSRKNLESFQIRNIPYIIQERMVKDCNMYDNVINNLINNNEFLYKTKTNINNIVIVNDN